MTQKKPEPNRRRTDAAIVIGLCAIGLAARAPFLSGLGHVDHATFVAWALRMQEGSLADAYRGTSDRHATRSASNYPPGHLYVLRGTAGLFTAMTGRTLRDVAERGGSDTGGDATERLIFAMFKLPAVLADLATGVLLYLALRRRAGRQWAAVVGVLFVLQPGVVYNSSRWGQVDAIHTLWMVASLEAATRRRYALMSLCGAIALGFKLQAIILAPLWLLCLLFGRDRGADAASTHAFSARLRELGSSARLRRIGVSLASAVLLILVASVPFVAQRAGQGLWQSYFGAVGHWPVASFGAFNFWGLACPLRPPSLTRDDAVFASLTLHTIGLLLLAAATCVVIARAWRRPDAPEVLRWASVALCLAFFTFPTQIHERYLHPAIAVAAWAFVGRGWWWLLWAGLGLAYGVNLTWVLPFGPGWPAAPAVSALANWAPGSWAPSQFWGLAVTAITVAVLAMPPRIWGDRRAAQA